MTVRSDASLLSLSALAMDKADDHLPAGAHLRWHLDPALGHPHAGFRLRRRPSPTWPWDKSEAFTAFFSKDTVATSAEGIHLRYAPLRIEQAKLAPDFAPRIEGRQPMRFVYEAREANDPPRQGFVRFAVLFEQAPVVGTQTFTLRGYTHHGGEKRLVAEHQERITLRVPTLRKIPARAQPVLMISAAELHSVEFTAPPSVKVRQIRYATPELLHRHPHWETVAVLPPLCMPGTAHVEAPTNVQQLALQRLGANRPLRRPGRPDDPSPGPLLTAADHSRFEKRMVTEAGNLAASLSAAFELELQQRRPPDSIMLADVTHPAGTANDRNDNDGSIDLPFYGVLQAGAFSPHIAAMLGLGHHDQRLGRQAYDYAVDAVFNQLWLSLSYLPPEARHELKLSALRMNLIAPQLDTVWKQEQPNFIRLIAFQPDLQAQAVAPLAAPQLKATVHADASRSPVQARVAVLAQPASPGTRLLMWRKASSIQPLSSLDAVTKLLLPALPAAEDGLCRFEDHALEAYGEVQYQAQDVDCFGRASALAPLAADIRDQVAPPAPAQPAIHLGTSSADELLFPAARLSTDISPALLQAAPDLVAITFMWRAGHHRAGDVLSRPDGRVQAAWQPTGGSSTVTAPVKLHVQRSDVRREVTAICVAVDAAGNVSPPSLASHAVLIDEIKPPALQQPAEPQWTSWPDAQGETRWCARWALPPNAASARVSAASESRLLALSGTDGTRHYALSHAERAAALKQLAITTPNAFVPEGLAYPASVSRHDVVLPAGSDDLRVVTIEFIGKTGQKADWPDTPTAFAVVRARPSEPATAPHLEVQQHGEADKITVRSQLAGTVELFALASPSQLKALDLLHPVATLTPDQDGQASHECLRDEPGWLGYCARLRAADGRVSEPSRLLWRAARTAADAPA